MVRGLYSGSYFFWSLFAQRHTHCHKKGSQCGESLCAMTCIKFLQWAAAGQRLYFIFVSSNLESDLMFSNRYLIKLKQIDEWIRQDESKNEELKSWNKTHRRPEHWQLVLNLAHESALLNESRSSGSLLLARYPPICWWLFWPLEREFSHPSCHALHCLDGSLFESLRYFCSLWEQRERATKGRQGLSNVSAGPTSAVTAPGGQCLWPHPQALGREETAMGALRGGPVLLYHSGETGTERPSVFSRPWLQWALLRGGWGRALLSLVSAARPPRLDSYLWAVWHWASYVMVLLFLCLWEGAHNSVYHIVFEDRRSAQACEWCVCVSVCLSSPLGAAKRVPGTY